MLALRTARIQLVPSPCFASTRIFVRTTMSDAAVIRSYNQDGLRNWFGRGLNSRSEVGVNRLGRVSLSKLVSLTRQYYKLPADNREMNVRDASSLHAFLQLTFRCQRLSLQHRIWKLMVRGLYPAEADSDVRRALKQAETISKQPQILDIGSGSGVW